MKKSKIILTPNELKILNDVYNIDVDKPESIQAFQEKALGTLTSIHEAQRQIYLNLNPHRKKRIANGKKCSFCLRAENEVHSMAKHESGFNLCNQCIKTVQKAERD